MEKYFFMNLSTVLKKKGFDKTILLILSGLFLGEVVVTLIGRLELSYLLIFNQLTLLGILFVVYRRQLKNFNRLDSAYNQLEYRDWIHRRFSWKYPVILNSRGWSASPDFLYELTQTIEEHGCSKILEVSSGLSTLICTKWVQDQKMETIVTSIEAEEYYLEKTAKSLKVEGLSKFSRLIHAPITEKSGVCWHDLAALEEQLEGPFDCLIVDGPPAVQNEMARMPALDVLYPHLAEQCLIILDDYSRPGETKIVSQWMKKYPLTVISKPITEKGMIVLKLTK